MIQSAPQSFTHWLPIAAAWLLGAFGGGAALAWLYRRLHPGLAFYKLWAFWSAVLGGVVAILLALGAVDL